MPKNNIAGEVFRVEWTELDYSKHSHKDTVSQITGLLLDLYLAHGDIHFYNQDAEILIEDIYMTKIISCNSYMLHSLLI